jgi:PAS domain-containing protein
MTKKPTYEELEQRVRELEEESLERKQVEDALRESEERLSSFMNSASDSMYLLDSDLNFVEVNKRGSEIIGKKREEVVGKKYH